jgi:hypothetical protein
LREGLEEIITINRLGINRALGRTLATTNPNESSIDIVRSHVEEREQLERRPSWPRGTPVDKHLRWRPPDSSPSGDTEVKRLLASSHPRSPPAK